MQSKNERGRSQEPLQSRSRVDASPTGRVLHGEPARQDLPFSFKQLPRRHHVAGEQPRPMILLEMEFSSIEQRILAANPKAADYLKP